MRTVVICGVLVLLGLLALSARPAPAQEPEDETGEEWAEEGRHELGLFLGVTSEEGDAGPSVGLDYEYRVTRGFGTGLLLEFTGADFREGLAGVPLYWHPWRELKLAAGPALQIEPAAGSADFVVRVGGEYGFPLRRGYEIAPAFYLDISRESVAIVAGAAVSKSF